MLTWEEREGGGTDELLVGEDRQRSLEHAQSGRERCGGTEELLVGEERQI